MKRLFLIWFQEYRNIFSDPGVMLIFFAAIIGYSFFYPLPYLHEVLKEVPIAVVDSNYSQLSRKLIRMADASEFLDVVSKPTSLAQAKKEFFEGKVYGIMVIPDDFHRKILSGEQAKIAVYSDAGYFLIYRQVMTGILQACKTMSAGIEIKRMLAGGLSETQAMAARDPLPLITFPLFNPSGGYASFVVPAVLVLILQQTLLIGIGMLGGTAREQNKLPYTGSKENNASVVPIVLGKTCAYLSLYLIHAIYYFGVLHRIYGFPQRGNPFSLVAFLLPFLIAVIFLGLAISCLFRSRETSMIALAFTSIPAIFLVGFSWPVESIPKLLHFVSFLLPSTAGIDGIIKINQMGATLNDVSFNWLLLWGITGIYFLLACLSIKYVMGRS